MSDTLITAIGITASALTAGSLIPQLVKLLKERQSEQVSLFMLCVLLSGLALWIIYGATKPDFIVLIANAIGFLINAMTLAAALWFKR